MPLTADVPARPPVPVAADPVRAAGPARRARWGPTHALVAVVAATASGGAWLYARAVGDRDDLATRALAHAEAVHRLERAWGLAPLSRLSEASLAAGPVRAVAAAVYALGYWPFLVLAGAWLWRRARPTFWRYALALATSGLVGVAAMTAYPTAPPRLAGLDDVVGATSWAPVAHPDGLLNPYGAMPSFHVGWSVLAAAALSAAARRRTGRVAAWAQPSLMAVAVLLTANHWALDVVAGAALAGAAWCAAPPLVRRIEAARTEARGAAGPA